ncbi:hypothetical protein KIN20_015507 [Parelaphostrongylus tenuis]|nr:hypothetical protein KIN20_015507 [Parelaphostrongylus tenuis]
MVDPLELLENPYSFFQHKPIARKRNLPPPVESSLVKKINLSDPPVFAPLMKNEPETLYPPLDSDYDSSDDDDDNL